MNATVTQMPSRRRGVGALLPDEDAAFRLARMWAVETTPYFAHALFAVTPVANPGLGTFGVDPSWRLYMDPALLVGDKAWTPQEAGAVLLHEIGHLIRQHADRASEVGDVDRKTWNLAGDCEINDDLVAAGVPLPGAPMLPESIGCPDGWAAESYYRHMLTQPPMPQGQGQGGGSGQDQSDDQGQGQGGGSGQDQSDDQGQGQGGGSGQDQSDDQGQGQAGAVGCGSGAGMDRNPGELSAQDARAEAITAAEADLIRRQVAEDVLSHAASSTGRGTVPDGLRRWADETLAPATVPWQRMFRAQVRSAVANKAGMQRLTYRRPSRRHPNSKIVFPGRRKPKITVAVVIDTSGSMGSNELNVVAAETESVLTHSGVSPHDITILTCDAKASEPQQVRHVRDVNLIGGGGTDMTIAIDWLENQRHAPDVIVVLTDGYTPWPDHPTNAKLVCGITRPSGSDVSDTPAWAVTALIPTDRILESDPMPV